MPSPSIVRLKHKTLKHTYTDYVYTSYKNSKDLAAFIAFTTDLSGFNSWSNFGTGRWAISEIKRQRHQESLDATSSKCVPRCKSAFGLAMTLTLDLSPWAPIKQYPMMFVAEMTYYVSIGTLNSAHQLTTHAMNLHVKFRWNPSTKYKIAVNGRTTRKRNASRRLLFQSQLMKINGV